jgi:hypothetical protein
MSDLLEVNGLDQALSVDVTPMLEKIDEVVEESIKRGDVYYALDFGVNLIQVAQLSGMGLAKLFYLLRENWDKFEIGDDFDSVAYSYVGRTKTTVDRYVRVWEMYENKIIPPEFEEEIRQKNIKDQIRIASLPAQGYEPTEKQWQEIVDAPDYNSVGVIARKIEGKEPRKSALLIFISPTGELSAQQEGIIEFVGYLAVDEAGEVAEKAIQRLLKSAGVLQR